MQIPNKDQNSFAKLQKLGLAHGIASTEDYRARCFEGRVSADDYIELYPSATSAQDYVKRVHERLFEGVHPVRTDEEGVSVGFAGQFRKQGEVLVKRGGIAAEPARIGTEMELLRSQSLEMEFLETMKPTERAAFAGARVAAIAPFLDGNVRTAWSIMNSNLISSGMTNEAHPMPAAEDLNEAMRKAAAENDLRPLTNILHQATGNEAEISNAPLPSPFKVAATLIQRNKEPLSPRDELEQSRRVQPPTAAPSQGAEIKIDYLSALRTTNEQTAALPLPLPTADVSSTRGGIAAEAPAERSRETTLV